MLSRIQQIVSKEGSEVLRESRRVGTSSVSTVTIAVPPNRFRTYVLFGGEKIPITLDEKNTLKRAANANPEFASLILLGFRPAEELPPLHHTLEQAYFCHPSDERTSGSLAAFAHLHASMLRKNVLAVGELLTRATAVSRLVVMLPLAAETAEQDDNTEVLQRPPGIMIVPLPFEEEVRAIGADAAVDSIRQDGVDLASNEVVEAAARLVEKQTIQNFEVGESLENARHTKYWDYVEHVALEQPLSADQRQFDTILDPEVMRKVVGVEADAFAACLPDDAKPEPKMKKRKLDPYDESSSDTWEFVYLQGRLDDCTNATLQKKLHSYGEKKTGKKQDLIDRLLPHLQAEFDAKKVKEDS